VKEFGRSYIQSYVPNTGALNVIEIDGIVDWKIWIKKTDENEPKALISYL